MQESNHTNWKKYIKDKSFRVITIKIGNINVIHFPLPGDKFI